jgi:hypothetical protein
MEFQTVTVESILICELFKHSVCTEIRIFFSGFGNVHKTMLHDVRELSLVFTTKHPTDT